MGPVVETTTGKVRGSLIEDCGVFLGIPFAEPPVGPDRFGAPIRHRRWEGTRDATRYGASAPQPHQQFTLIPEPIIEGDNCLNLNVFTPDPGAAGLPVLAWIHGGGFFAGCNASPWYRGMRFGRDGVVVVSINYRLGAEGFLVLDGAPANRGVLDWLSGLEWIQDNIERFGGDPARVTVAGQSAGGAACAALLSMPRSKGLFSRVVAMSGAAQFSRTIDDGRRTAEQLAEQLGIAPTRAAFEDIDAEKLVGGQRDAQGALTLAPLLDGELIADAPLESIRSGTGSDLELLIGTTAEEVNATFLAAADKIDEERLARRLERLKLDGDKVRGYRASMPEAQPWQILAQATTDSMFRAPAGRLADARADAAGKSVVADPAATYAYEYRWRSPARGGLGACHCLDLPFVFDVLDADGVRGVLGADPPQHLADTMHRAWVDFITTGDPGWEPYGALRRPTMAFDDECSLVTDPLKVARDTFG